MNPLVLAAALITTPTGNTFVQPVSNGYNVWSQEGLTQVRDYNGWQQIKTPDGETTNVIDLGGPSVPIMPIVPVDVGGEAE